MNIHDLRIGNWISIYKPMVQSHVPHKVKSIVYGDSNDCYKIELHGCNQLLTEKALKRIPLTESILPLWGFELLDTDGEDWDKSLDDPNDDSKFAKVYAVFGLELAVSCTGDIYTIYRCEDDWYDHADKKIEFLHDLQNYYYVMNKRELDIKI